jgi:FtsZ-interacting cell division protein ZipA
MSPMSELRWTLLILGVVFIAALTWWERRRPRQAFAPRLREPSTPRAEAYRVGAVEPPPGEPWIGESSLSDVVSSEMALANEPEGREELPTIIIRDGFPASLASSPMRVSEEAPWLEPPPPEPKLIDPESAVDRLEPMAAEEPVAATLPEPEEIPAPGGMLEAAAAPAREPLPEAAAAPAQEPLPEAAPVPARAPLPEAAPAPLPEAVPAFAHAPAQPPAAPESPAPIVEWPPEESRRILALRVVAPPGERFAGRNLRLALAAEGFVLGKFSIFHKPDEMNRAVISAASLNKPGAFDPETLDSQRYGGLALFVVLPGAKAPPQAFEELLAAARNLNERLAGALQDERGSPLTALRLMSLRESLRAEAATRSAAAANGA